MISGPGRITQKRNKITDKKRLDYLDAVTSVDCGVICRHSTTDRGWRLHEVKHWQPGHINVRDAIDEFIKANDANSCYSFGSKDV